MDTNSDANDLYSHVGHDFSVVHTILKSLVVGNSSTVVEIVNRLDSVLDAVQRQEYDDTSEQYLRMLCEDLQREANHPETEMTPEQAARVTEAVDHALEAYRAAAVSKPRHEENR